MHTGGILGLEEEVGWGQGLGCWGLAPWRPFECVSGASCLAVPATGGLLFSGLKDDCCPLSLLPRLPCRAWGEVRPVEPIQLQLQLRLQFGFGF